MNSSVWAIWEAQGSKVKNNEFKFFRATCGQKEYFSFFLHISSVHTKKLHNISFIILFFISFGVYFDSCFNSKLKTKYMLWPFSLGWAN